MHSNNNNLSKSLTPEKAKKILEAHGGYVRQKHATDAWRFCHPKWKKSYYVKQTANYVTRAVRTALQRLLDDSDHSPAG